MFETGAMILFSRKLVDDLQLPNNSAGMVISSHEHQGHHIKVIIEPGEDGYFVAHVPSLKSCWSQGKTREEALQNIREAIDLYLEPEPNELAEDQELVELTM